MQYSSAQSNAASVLASFAAQSVSLSEQISSSLLSVWESSLKVVLFVSNRSRDCIPHDNTRFFSSVTRLPVGRFAGQINLSIMNSFSTEVYC
ncbi:hypothetical protein R1flu_022303 [Riccia fluitans]|uniref:Uncharacterized protein n=1 Tax=Riccia fluitans TaxID=41844 RepID=A0ABD1ZS54_9MARC